MNGFWKEEVPDDCPKCQKNGSYEEIPCAPIHLVDRSREKNWKAGLTPDMQARVLAGEVDPY